MVKKLIFVVPVQLNENGTLSIKNIKSLKLMVYDLKDSYEITLLVQSYREKTVSDLSDFEISVIYDNSVPKYQTDANHYLSRFQSSYWMWADRKIKNNINDAFIPEYDCVLAWDGCSPWCLATSLRFVNAKRKLIWVHDDPELYLMSVDRLFYKEICGGSDAIIASDDDIINSLNGIYEKPTLGRNVFSVNLPLDVSWYWEQSKQPCAYEFSKEEMILLIVSAMNRESILERLPMWLAFHQDYRLPIHCYFIGEGNRFDRYVQQIAIHSVDHMVTLVGQTKNPYPYIRKCDALLVCENERHPELKTVAEAFGVPVILFEEIEQRLPELKKRKVLNELPFLVWRDKNKLIQIFEGDKV